MARALLILRSTYRRHTHPRLPVPLRLCIHEVHVAPLHASAQQHAVGVLDKVGECFAAALNDAVFRVLALSDPAEAFAVDEVVAEDDAAVVKLEALGGVDAADLVCSDPPLGGRRSALGVRWMEGRLRPSAASSVWRKL